MRRSILLCCLLIWLLCAACACAEPPAPDGFPLLPGIEFIQNQKYPVYSGPGEEYLRAGNGKASVSTKDWIQVFGADSGYLMIRYETSPGKHRIGYIPQEVTLNAEHLKYLDWDWRNAHLPLHAIISENPFDPITDVTAVTEEIPIYLLRDLGEWVYFETAQDKPMRAFARSQDVVLDPVSYAETDAFVQAIGFLEEIDIDAQVTGIKDNTLYLRLANGGMAKYWHYGGEYAPYEMNWHFRNASNADIEKYLDANLRLLLDVKNGRTGEAHLQPDSEHGARNIQAVISNGLGYLENLGVQALDILRRQLIQPDADNEISSLRARLELRLRSSNNADIRAYMNKLADIKSVLRGTWRFAGGAEICGFGIAFLDDDFCQLYDTDDYSVFPPANLFPFGEPGRYILTNGKQDGEYDLLILSKNGQLSSYTLSFASEPQSESHAERLHLGVGEGGGFYERYEPEAAVPPDTRLKPTAFSCGTAEIIGYCRIDKQYNDPWSTPSHIYQKPDDASSIALEIWGGNGEWFTLLERCGDWLRVRKYEYEGYIRADSVSIFPIESMDKAIVGTGEYTAGRDIAAGFYSYSGGDGTLIVRSPLYTEGEIRYEHLPARNELYLPTGCTVFLSSDETLSYIHPDTLEKNIRTFDMLLGSGRIFVPGHMDMSQSTYTITLLDESSSVHEYDLLGNPLPALFRGVFQPGEAYQLQLDEGRFIEYEDCLIERATSSG